ncbi:cell wall integrity protein scw1-like isoform X2 [Papaver somniferum]|uniref:cell wall integrity protein scw1-like isoform X2 n=1 Tax=Papaver somniferum TaxID=3469 RepID=UPI000E6FC9B2|nr:cell wall integrity protein scw1-like isoform X2 [Papaver somniferum]
MMLKLEKFIICFEEDKGLSFLNLNILVVAFATFLNHHTAMAAMNSLNGATFDPQSGACLHIELARSNSRTKRVREGAGRYLVIDKRGKLSADEKETSSNDGDDGFDEPSGSDNPDSSNKDGLTTAESADTTIHGDDTGAPANSENTAKGELQPCSTLFIANLGPNCTEDELRQALSPYPGFKIVKMRAKCGMPVAFADFEEVEQANEAMQNLQGTTLPTSDRGGLHLEYARSKMRKA